MKGKTCSITGHRDVDNAKTDYVKKAIKDCVVELINQGYTHFISGFADGIDLYFAEIVAELKKEYDITLEAAIPYRNRVNCKKAIFRNLLAECNIIGIHSEEYSKSSYLKRNRFMVEQSSLVICVYDGRETGGTFYTKEYAEKLNKEIKLIAV
ncbi:MAG: SLOG family protein [Lachnospirales bacterium]